MSYTDLPRQPCGVDKARNADQGKRKKITHVTYRKPQRDLLQKPAGIKNNDVTGRAVYDRLS